MLSNLLGHIGERAVGNASGLRSLLRGSNEDESGGHESRLRLDGYRPAFVPIEYASRAFDRRPVSSGATDGSRVRTRRGLSDGSGVGSRTERRARIGTRAGAELAVLGRAVLFALATIAGSVDPGGRIPGDREAGLGPDHAIDEERGEATVGRRLRENGPVVLVPLAWSFATAAHLGRLETRTVLIAHLVIDALLAAFAAASWSEMTEGVLRAWKLVLLVGLGVTLSGTAALLGTAEEPGSATREAAASTGAEAGSARETTLALTVLSWMIVPAAGLAYTGLRVDEEEAPRVYLLGALCSVLGALAYASAPTGAPASSRKLFGLALANVGQTAGIVNAVHQY